MPLPAPVTLAGFGGINIGMMEGQVARLLHSPPVMVFLQGSAAEEYMAICAGPMRGTARFFGADGLFDDPRYGRFQAVWFSAGAKTDRGVGVGSTRAAVIRAYGSKLKHNSGDLYLEGKGATRDRVFMQPAIYFAFAAGRVELLGYGRSAQLFGATPSVSTFC